MIDLPPRAGERPKTTNTNPHQQQSQNPTPEVYELLLSKAFDLPHVERRPSAISVPGAQALWLAEEVAGACPEAFLIGREFAHLHPPYDGSMHMMLPPEAVEELLGKGWGEPHPMARRGLIPATAVMVYAPRDVAEVDTVLQVIAASYRFARGEDPRLPHPPPRRFPDENRSLAGAVADGPCAGLELKIVTVGSGEKNACSGLICDLIGNGALLVCRIAARGWCGIKAGRAAIWPGHPVHPLRRGGAARAARRHSSRAW